ncbi:GntR family transcriptional regulator [Pannonibacter carbonis]|uniref:GntR family transcriptional regulator n=1 Tax=Pannonibacter carbonis TaxID=2067569 RepID=UPI000D10F4CB|nr:GntR family transcriptional regulator [Pannonibacter carbonis]
MTDTPRKETISSRISGQLRSAILRGELEPGSKINLDRLKEQHDTSISPLREAMARLVADGLVLFEDQKGYRVAPVSRGNLEEVTRLRAEFETMALEASIVRGDLDWESDVLRALHQLRHTPRKGNQNPVSPPWDEVHSAFHYALIQSCGMPVLLGFCRITANMQDRYANLYMLGGEDERDVASEHDEIARAATERNAAKATAALKRHILRTGEALALRFPD